MSNPISRFIGQKAWEMSHPKQVKKEEEMTKKTTPAEHLRDMRKESIFQRYDEKIDKKIEEEGK